MLTLISTEKPDILAGTETWLTPDVTNNEIILPEFGYNIYRKDRLNGYGGVLLAVANTIPSIDLPSLSTDCEIVWAKLNITGSPMYIAAYYRPHVSDSCSLTQLDLSLHKLKETTKNATILLTGDFNLPGIDWSTNLVKSDSPYKAIHECSLEILHDHALQQLVDFPTRLSNTLDLVATNKPSSILNIRKTIGVSDHDIVLFEVMSRVKLSKQLPRTIYMYDRANMNALREELHTLLGDDTETSLGEENIEQLWSKFKVSIAQVVDKYI